MSATIKWRGRDIPALLPGVEYDPEKHEYKVDGQHFPSVSSFLSALQSPFIGLNSAVAAEWGTSAHTHLYHLIAGNLDMKRVSERMMPTIQGFEKALGHLGLTRINPALCEYIVYSKRLRFAGRFDFLFADGNRDVLVDFKTGTPSERSSRMTGMQLGGYLYAGIECKLIKLSSTFLAEINVQPDGKFEVRRFGAERCMNVFVAQATVKNYFDNL